MRKYSVTLSCWTRAGMANLLRANWFVLSLSLSLPLSLSSLQNVFPMHTNSMISIIEWYTLRLLSNLIVLLYYTSMISIIMSSNDLSFLFHSNLDSTFNWYSVRVFIVSVFKFMIICYMVAHFAPQSWLISVQVEHWFRTKCFTLLSMKTLFIFVWTHLYNFVCNHHTIYMNINNDIYTRTHWLA